MLQEKTRQTKNTIKATVCISMVAKGKHCSRNIVPYSKWQNSSSLNVKIVFNF